MNKIKVFLLLVLCICIITVSYTVGEISDSSQRKFKIEILRGNTVLITKESSSFYVVKHVAPTASGIQTSYSNGILTLSFIIPIWLKE